MEAVHSGEEEKAGWFGADDGEERQGEGVAAEECWSRVGCYGGAVLGMARLGFPVVLEWRGAEGFGSWN